MSRIMEKSADPTDTVTMGTVTHMPPELLLEGKLSPAADVYAFGERLASAGRSTASSPPGSSPTQQNNVGCMAVAAPPADCLEGLSIRNIVLWLLHVGCTVEHCRAGLPPAGDDLQASKAAV